jgi:Amt family ammonium transporter
MFSSVDTIWVLLGAALVFFMQAGFCMVETGFTRAKNAGNIVMKNVMDISAGSIFFWLIGFGILFGDDVAGLIGKPDIMLLGDSIGGDSYPKLAFLIFQTVFCATAATIVSGAMAERTKFVAYLCYSIVISALVYPISSHWIWGGGWLYELGFHDFAGSTAVHMVGGAAGLVGVFFLGPRIGKYSKDGKVNAIPGHSLTLGALGVFILWLCWFGFNGCSTVSMTGDDSLISASLIFVNTNLAAAAGAFTACAITWFKYGKPDVSMTLNGALGGLVAITAGCDAVLPYGAVLIAIIAGVFLVFGIEFLDQKVRIDDPVGAIGVHGICGAVGTILVGVFAIDGGLLYGGGAGLLGVQTLGVAAVFAWIVVAMGIAFFVINKTVGLRVTKEEEIVGLDITEHALSSSYADFATNITTISEETPHVPVVSGEKPKATDGLKMTKIAIITRESKFDELKNALSDVGITGLTVTQVLGAGYQRGHAEYYRGAPLEVKLHPKVRVEIVVCKVPVSVVVEAAKKVLYTGGIGDGKIFTYNVESVYRIRTGEKDYDALQDEVY